MKLSRILLLLVALMAGGLAAWLATRGGDNSGPAPVQVAQQTRTQVLVAKADIGLGERLSDQNLEWQDWPDSGVRPDYITSQATPNAITDMKGAVARFEIFPGEPVDPAKLVRADQGYLSAVLDKGMRGVSISVNADSASGGFIVPNDHVDVILTHNTAEGQEAETILQNVRVLAINTRLGETGKTGSPDDPNDPKQEVFANTAIATLELDPAQAETVVNANQMGKLSLSLRSIVDFTPDAGTIDTAVKRNAPIRIIRYGLEANVTPGTAAATPASATSPFSIQGLTQPPVSVTVAPGAAAGAGVPLMPNQSTSPSAGTANTPS